MIRSYIATLLLFALVGLSGCSSADGPATSTTEPLPAPDFASGVDWLNVPSPPSIARLEGKVTVVYFWTTSCLACRDVIDDVERLENEFPEAVVPIGIHTGRFEAESDASVIEQFLTRRGLDHAIANDGEYRIWQEWEITSWPTTLVIDQAGMVTARHSGDDAYEALEPVVGSLADDPPVATNPESVVFTNQPALPPPTVLSFPEAVLADPAGGRLFIADTNHHRIVVADLDTNDVLEVIGNGDEGFTDGDADQASFSEPRGMALSNDGSTLYVADSANHLIREVNLASRRVSTIAGTGERGRPQEGEPLDSPLNYPWDVAVIDQDLYVSVAGANQIWHIDLAESELKQAAGTGQAGVGDGPANDARLAQPSGLAQYSDNGLVIADSGSSSLRLLGESEVSALIGPVDGLFDFGEADGPAATARFQYPMGVATTGEIIWVADTFNHRIRGIDPNSGQVTTLAGSEAGWQDGNEPLFTTPTGIDAADGSLYLADTGNHSIRRLDMTTGETETLVLQGIELLVTSTDDTYDGVEITLDELEVKPGPGAITLDVAFPAGYKINPLAPSRFEWSNSDVAAIDPGANQSITGPTFPLEVTTTFAEGEGTVQADLWLVYCEADQESICLFDRTRINIPLQVTANAASTIASIDYEVTLPDLS